MLLTIAGCGDAEKTAAGVEAYASVAANAGELDEATKAARAKDEEERKQKFAEEEAAAKAEQEAWEAELKRVVVLPEVMPKNLKKACEDLPRQHQEYMQRVFVEDEDAGPLMIYFDNKAELWGEMRGKCLKVNSLPAVACQMNVLANAGPITKGKDKIVLAKCVETFAPEAIERIATEEKQLKGG